MKEEITRENDKVIAETKEFKGKKYLDIRSYYFDQSKQTYLPGKGITIKEASDFLFLLDALTKNKDEIIKYLSK